MTIAMFSKKRVPNRDGVEMDMVDTKCAQWSSVQKIDCRFFAFLQHRIFFFLICESAYP